MKRVFKASLMAMIAISVGVGTVYAAVHYADWVEVTDMSWKDGTQTNMVLNKKGLFCSDVPTDKNNTIRMYDGTDSINFGAGGDVLHMSWGADAICFGGDDESSVVSFDTAGSGLTTAFTDSASYIRVDTPDSDSQMEMRSNNVTITANDGDVVIRIGN